MPIGRPIANTRVYILDKSLRPLPAGLPGELYIGGDGLAELIRTAGRCARFVPILSAQIPEVVSTRRAILRRYLEGGTIEFLGRSDYQVKIRGYRSSWAKSKRSEPVHKGSRVCSNREREIIGR